jgi:HK97 family phage major capsid protein
MSTTIKVPKELRREALIERTEVDGRKGFKMSISSDVPYKRYDWWNEREYYEVLDHGPGGCNDARLKKGLPILFNHDRDQHLGRATAYANDGHKYEVTDLIWSESEFAQTKKKDAESGALPDTSVGYRLIDEGVQIGEKDGLPVYRFRWEIHEASLVTIPADITVGVGRSKPDEKGEFVEVSVRSEQETLTNENLALAKTRKNENTPVMADTTTAAPEQKIDVVQERNTAVAAERKRVADIQELSGHFASNGLGGRKIDTTECAAQHIREGKNVEEFQKAVVMGSFKEVIPVETKPEIGLSRKDLGKYSLIRALGSMAAAARGEIKFDGLEREVSDAAKRAYKHFDSKEASSPATLIIPHDVMNARMFMGEDHQRALQTNVFSAAGALVGTDILSGSMIELLRNKMRVVELGARSLGGLVGNIAIPSHTGSVTTYWLAEGGTITASNPTVGQLSLTPHRLGALCDLSFQLIAQSSIDVENFVRTDIMQALALARDKAALVGSGTAGEPLGVFNLPAAQLSTPVTLANAGTITYAEAVRFETNVSNNNADVGSLGYLSTPTVKGGTKVTAMFSSTGFPVWGLDDTMNGYKARTSLQHTTTHGGAALTPTTLFGNWADMILADWAGLMVTVDPYTRAAMGELRVVMQLMCDNGVRHGKSFAKSSN